MSKSMPTINTAVDIPVCTSIEEIKAAKGKDTELQILQASVIRGWLQNKDELDPSLCGHWPKINSNDQ